MKHLKTFEENQYGGDNLRAIEVTYDTGDVIQTSMAANLTDEEMLDYFKVGRQFNIGLGPHDKMAIVVDAKILK
jgi:hypothetical protein